MSEKYQILVRAKLDDIDLSKQLEELQKKLDKASSGSKTGGSTKSFGKALGDDFRYAATEIEALSPDLEKIRTHFLGLGENIKNIKISKIFDPKTNDIKQYSVSLDKINGQLKDSQRFTVDIGKDGEHRIKQLKSVESELKKVNKVTKSTALSTENVAIQTRKWSDRVANIRASNEKLFDKDVGIQKTNADLEEMMTNFEKFGGTAEDVKKINAEVTHLGSSFSTLSKNVRSAEQDMAPIPKTTEDISANLVKWNDALRNMEATNPAIFNTDEVKELRTEIDGLMTSYEDTPLDQVGEKTKELNREMAHLRSTTSSVTKEVGNQNKEMVQAAKAGDSWGTVIKKNTLKVLQWAIATGALYGALKQIKDGIQYIRDLNKELTNIQIVTGMSGKEIARLATNFNDLAIEMGATTVEVAAGSTEWFRQGKTIEETTELMRATMMLSKLGNLEAAQSTEYLTSTLNGFKLEAEDAIGVVDVLINLDNEYATSAGEISAALQRSANSAQQVGVDLEKLASIITVISSVTRKSADSIGTSLKTMFARLSAIKLGKMFEDDATNINDVEKALSLVNIKLRDSETSFRDMGDVFDDIAIKWDTMNELEQSAVSTAIAGKMYARTYSDVWEFAY